MPKINKPTKNQKMKKESPKIEKLRKRIII
jgi:hypothetical protein